MNGTDVVVVGGGIGGLASALALSRAGLRVRVLEQAERFGEVGAGLQLAPNATRILRGWGLLDEVVASGVLPRRLVLRDAVDGRELTHLDLADVARRYGAPYLVTHRGDLHATLERACRAAGVELVTGAEVAEVELHADRAVAVGSARRDTAAAVLAADGLGSRMRRMLSADEPVSSAYVAYRGTVPTPEPLDAGPRDVVVHIGPRCHLVRYALRRGELLNQVAVFQSPGALAGEPDWGGPEELAEAFAHTCAEVRAALPRLWRDRRWRMFDREPLDAWVRGRFALVGDAAHPMLQYLAQGACQALEDAEALATQLVKHGAPERVDWDAALAGYVEVRAPRTARIQRTARQWGELWHCDGLFRAVRNVLLRDRDPADYRYVDWLYQA